MERREKAILIWAILATIGCLVALCLWFWFPREKIVEVPVVRVVERVVEAPAPEAAPQPVAVPVPEAVQDPAQAGEQLLKEIDSHILAWLPLTENLEDHSRDKLETTVNGDVKIDGGAAYFDGESSWIQLPHIELNERPFAVSMRIKLDGEPGGYGLVEQKGGGDADEHLHLMLRSRAQPYLGFYVDDCKADESVNREDGWTHLVFQFTGERQEIWINGDVRAEHQSNFFKGESGATFVGRTPRWGNVTSSDFKGWMCDVRIYDQALSQSQIHALAGTLWRHGEQPNQDGKF